MAEPITITLQAGTVLLIGERIFALFVAPRMRAREEPRKGQSSGEKDPAYWENKFGQVIDEKLDQRIIPILEKESQILESLARTMEGVATSVKELADSSRRRRR